MALATTADVTAALGRGLTSAESATVENLLDQASDLVVGYLGYTPSPVPGAVARVAATMVVAVYAKPATNTADYGVNGYNVIKESLPVKVGEESATSEGPWLTNALKMRLRPYRLGAFSVALVSEEGS